MESSDTVVVIARFNHRHEAETARGFLEAAGLPAIVRADDGGGAFGAPLTFSLGSFAELLVHAEVAEDARSVLSDAGLLAPDEEE